MLKSATIYINSLYKSLLSSGLLIDEMGNPELDLEEFTNIFINDESLKEFHETLIEISALDTSYEEFYENIRGHFPIQEFYPLSENQRGIHIDWELHKNSTQYNLPYVLDFKEIDYATLYKAINHVLCAHPHLKMQLSVENGEIVQKRRDELEISVLCKELKSKPQSSFFQERVRPFNLFTDDLCRFEIYIHGDITYLFMDFHHIIFDGLSYIIFIKDLTRAINGEVLEKETFTAYDNSIVEEKWKKSVEYEKAESYFEKLVDKCETASYPHSPKPDTTIPSSRSVNTFLKADSIINYCKENAISEYSFFTTAACQVLHRILREESLFVTTVYHGRNNSGVQNITGMLVKTIPVVSNEGETTFVDSAKVMMQQALDSQEYSQYGYTKIVERHGKRAEIMLVYQPKETIDSGFYSDKYTISLDTVKLPLTISFILSGEDYIIHIEYDSSLYSKEDMQILSNTIKTFAQNTIETGFEAINISKIKLVSPEEEKALLELGSGEILEYDHNKTFVDLFLKQVINNPNSTAVVDGKSEYSYDELNKVSNAIANKLLSKGLKINDFVCVLLPRIKEFVASVIGIMKAGGAYVPLDMEYPEDRKHYMINDSESKIVITEDWLKELDVKDRNKEVNLARKDGYAYMIYTSGSTGKPKGVVIKQESIMACYAWQKKEFKHAPGKKNLLHPSFSFDASTFDLLYPLMAGGEIHIADEELRMNLTRLISYINSNNITGMTINTSFGMVLLNDFNLEMDYIMLGGERLLPTKKSKTKIYNGYGPTEFTVCSSFYLLDYKEKSIIPIGRPVPNSRTYICDKYGNLLPFGIMGEICLSGMQLSEGYWKQPKQDSEKYIKASFDNRIYRTGDFGCWNENQELVYLGRKDYQIKVRGYRVELGEIETVARQYEGVSETAVSITNINQTQQICLYFVTKRNIDINKMKIHMSRFLAKYMQPSFYIQMEYIPRTPNGKIDYNSLPSPVYEQDKNVSPKTSEEKLIHDVVAEIMNKNEIGMTTDLISLGMSSLMAMQISSKLLQKFNFEISTQKILQNPTIQMITSQCNTVISNEHHAYQDFYNITDNQRGIYIEWEKNKNTIQYNTPALRRFDNISPNMLIKALEKLLHIHSYLKVKLVNNNGEIIQKRNDNEDAIIYYQELEFEPDKCFFQNRVIPFNLINNKLYRLEIYKTPLTLYLFQDIHHIVFDGISNQIFNKELEQLINDEKLKHEDFTAFDYSIEEHENISSKEYDIAANYFKNLVKNAMMARYPESIEDTDTKNHLSYIESSCSKEKITEYCNTHSLTIKNFFLTALMIVLHRVLREELLGIATITNGRKSNMSRSIGMFVKTIPLVSSIEHTNIFEELANDLQKQSFRTEGYYFYPFTELVTEFNLKYDVVFSFQDESSHFAIDKFNNLKLDSPKFPLLVSIFKVGKKFIINIEYDNSIYSQYDMNELLKMFIKVTNNAIENNNNIRKMPLLDENEIVQIIKSSKGEVMTVDENTTFIKEFIHQVKINPSQKAISDGTNDLSYKELDIKSNILANWLVNNGIVGLIENNFPFVGIMLGRRYDFTLAVIGVEKSGAAYIPLEEDLPLNRLYQILDNSKLKIIITDKYIYYNSVLKEIKNDEIKTVFIDDVFNENDKLAKEQIDRSTPEGIAYMIYTSGTTGSPKGVAISHRAKINLLYYMAKYIHNDVIHPRILCHSSFSFDGSIDGLYTPLIIGGTSYIVPENIRHDLSLIYKFIVTNNISSGFLTTQLGVLLLQAFPALPFNKLIVGGEKLTNKPNCNTTIINGYGPTEFTMFATTYELRKDTNQENIPIGRPLPNLSAYVIDKYNNLLPNGCIGELCLAGPQIAKGYWNEIELTELKFGVLDFTNEKVYHTGDLVRYNKNNQLQYIGRIDEQIKIRGYRIEIGEIESTMSQYEGITSQVVIVKNDGGTDYLCAFYTSNFNIKSSVILEFLSQRLPNYMIPSVLMQIQELPLTQNGKIDKRKLQKIQLFWNREKKCPQNQIEENIVEVFCTLLPEADLGIDENFFNYGFNSILAMRLVIELNKLGYNILYEDVFNYTTIQKLSDHIQGNDINSKCHYNIEDYNYEIIQKYLKKRTQLEFDSTEQNTENYLITGVTGYLGIHILNQLICKSNKIVYCLIRANNKSHAENRLTNLYKHYFSEDIRNLIGNKIHIIVGEITDFILPNIKVDKIINCAAIVKHFSETSEIETVNIKGTEHCVEYCINHNSELIHVSTISISGTINGSCNQNNKIAETDFYIGQELNNKYTYSKFIAERIVLESIINKGLKAKIMRVGNLSPRKSDGKFQYNSNSNSFMGRLRVFNMLGCYPLDQYGLTTDLSPIDEVAKAIVLLSSKASNNIIFHPFNSQSIELGRIIKLMKYVNRRMKFVDKEIFISELDKAKDNPDMVKYLTSLLAYDQGKANEYEAPNIENNYTTNVLEQLGFKWSNITDDYIINFLKKLNKQGFFNAKEKQ